MSETVAQAPLDDEAPDQGKPSAAPKTDTKDTKSESQPNAPKDGGKAAKDSGGPPPWANDLAERGLDDPRISDYLNEVWQPRMTQFEQQVSEWSGMFGGDMERAQIMSGLAEALDNDPEGTYRQMGELLGLSDSTDGEYDDEQGEFGVEDDEADDSEQPDEYREWVMSKMQEEQQGREDQQYQSLLDEIAQTTPGFDPDLFHAAIVAFDGDPEMAMEWYMKYHRAPEAPDTPDGPTPVGEGNPTPPEAKEYSGIGDAIADFMSQDKAAKAPR
jgi:hypothetical protein